MSTPLAAFGPGIVIVTRTDTVTPMAVNVGYANEFTFEQSVTTKQLYGQNQFPLVAARGTVKVTGKIKAATLSGLAWNACFFGQSFVTGRDSWFIDEPHTAAANTATVTNVTGGIVDLGVKYASTGIPLQRVAAGAEVAGKYSVVLATGVYTFAVADNVPLLFTYTNFASATAGQQLQVNNLLIGVTPTFQIDYYTNLNQPTSLPFSIRAFSCISSKLALAAKLEDFIMPEIDFDVFANASGQVYNVNFPQIS